MKKLSTPNSQAIARARSRKETSAFDYEAVQNTNRRKGIPSGQKPHQDVILKRHERKRGERLTNDVLDNYPLAGWMIRRHLDAVSSFYFDVDKAAGDNRKVVMDLLREHGKARNFDAAKRHSRDEAMRLFEMNKVLDGDSLMAKITAKSSPRYGSVQLVEGSQITKPSDFPKSWNTTDKFREPRFTDQGLELDSFGGAKSFIVCKYARGQRVLKFDRRVLARNAIYSGYFDRYQQTRGISPLLCAMNQLLDIKEGMEYILLKIKLHALFGYAITQDAIDSADGLPSTSEDVEDECPGEDGVSQADVSREIDISNGPFGLNLIPGENVKTIESETPPESVRDYTGLAIRCALLALDIPYTFFDGRSASFSHIIADRKMYEESIRSKRGKNEEVMEQYLDWKVQMWIDDGDIKGTTYEELRPLVHVHPRPSPWLDKMSEIQASEREVALGLKSIPTLGKERNVDVFAELEKQSEYLKQANELDVPIYVGHPGQRSERDNEIDNDIKEIKERQDENESDD